jgi:hypothetical protein
MMNDNHPITQIGQVILVAAVIIVAVLVTLFGPLLV